MTDVPDVPPEPEAITAQTRPPILPVDAQRSEIEALLVADRTALGDIWRRTQAGETPEQIQAARGAAFPNFVWSYLRTARALIDGDLPTAPTVALATARTFRRILNEAALSPGTDAALRANLALLESRAASEAARVIEDEAALDTTELAEAEAVQGIYVYALPHYLRHPYDEESNRTLLKVGRSDRSVIRRFREQTRTTALPEEPVLLRIYVTPSEDTIAREREFHELLDAADHARSLARTGGTEWFLTSVRFLDTVAATLHLEIRRVYDPGTL